MSTGISLSEREPYLIEAVMRETAAGDPQQARTLNQINLAPSLLALCLSRQTDRACQAMVEELLLNYAEAVGAGTLPWREPELLWSITKLLLSDTDGFEAQAAFVRFHMNPDLTLSDAPACPFLRSPYLRSKIYARASSGELHSTPLEPIFHEGPRVIPCIEGLYADMLKQDLYCPRLSEPTYRSIERVLDGLEEIKEFSTTLYNEMLETISVIAISGDMGRPGFSCRTNYYGGIFVNTSFEAGEAVAETLIHEFLHQKLWLWWEFDEVIPPASAANLICSPITGQSRTADVMLQAFLIYSQCKDFYEWAIAASKNHGGKAAWREARLRLLKERLPLLRCHLAQHFPRDSRAGSVLACLPCE